MGGSVTPSILCLLRIIFLTSFVQGQQVPPDLVMFNGNIFTSNTDRPHVEALAIRGDRIVAVGVSKDMLALAGKKTLRIDLAGHTVVRASTMHIIISRSRRTRRISSSRVRTLRGWR